jgi:hypothetical protein
MSYSKLSGGLIYCMAVDKIKLLVNTSTITNTKSENSGGLAYLNSTNGIDIILSGTVID